MNQFKSEIGRNVSWREMFSLMDHNGDGKISFHEFLTGATNKAHLLNEETLDKAFNLLDRDGDGYLEANDLKWRFSYFNKDGIVNEL